ncbi:MAG: acyl-CoA dehydrogenase [Candidatus Binatus sp.]|uniref:acyl-CoA dehydrogenase family protein n=1 Tax=Candidatus Binatus sp. TaxID=2811406 RepID=UPI0027239E5F|nr:acyl-CoA dehydrogenase [Candidatus Binatus sp.]MDO8431252.1 acyl-CoA dehydrogenase [Candidatus Binatus sp.]
MISFELSEEQQLAQSMARTLAADALRPAARDADERETIPKSILDEIWATGIVQSQADSASDAAGRSCTLNALLLEELAVADAAFAIAAAAPIGFLSAIASQGSAAQKKNLLPLFEGDHYRCAAVAIMEPDFAFDVSAIRTAAIKTRDGYRLSGIKGLVPLTNQCSHFLVIARCDGNAEAFIVDRNAKGVVVGEKKPNIGLRALEMATVSFNDVELSASARLGESAGCDVQRIVDSARTALSAVMTGTSRAVMEFVMPYTKERIVHGDALAKKQTIAFRLADMRIETDAMRWMTWKAASILEQGGAATRQAQLAYTYAAEQAMWIADEGVQMLGGHGYLRDNPVEMWYCDARTVSVLEGAVGV